MLMTRFNALTPRCFKTAKKARIPGAFINCRYKDELNIHEESELRLGNNSLTNAGGEELRVVHNFLIKYYQRRI